MPQNYQQMRETTARMRIAMTQGIDRVEERAQDHIKNLSLFQQWSESKFAEIETLCDELGLLEQVLQNSSPYDDYQMQAPLILAVAYSKAAEKICRMEPKQDSIQQILKPFKDVMILAAKTCLIVSDKSKCALGQDEYSTMTITDRQKLQHEQFARILQFFNSAQDELLFDPQDEMMDRIVKRLSSIVWPQNMEDESKSRHVSFQIQQVNPNDDIDDIESAIIQQIRCMARTQALLFELIQENEEILQCFFLEKDQLLTVCANDHLPPSKLLRCMCQVVSDILWQSFEEDYAQSNYHVMVIANWRSNSNTSRLTSKALLELWERYEAIKAVEENYLSSLYKSCENAVANVIHKFSEGCSCRGMFHLHLTIAPPCSPSPEITLPDMTE